MSGAARKLAGTTKGKRARPATDPGLRALEESGDVILPRRGARLARLRPIVIRGRPLSEEILSERR